MPQNHNAAFKPCSTASRRLRYRAADGAPEWAYLLIMLDFQSRVGRDMAMRVHNYTGQLYLQHRRGPDGRRGGPLPPVLPIVIYNGLARRAAAQRIEDAVAPVGPGPKRFQPRQDYLLLDIHRMPPAELPADNVVSARFALEHGDPLAVPGVVAALRRLLVGPEHAELRQMFAATLRHVLEAERFGPLSAALSARLRRMEALEDLDAMTAMFEKRLDGLLAERGARERARGLERERALLARQAGRKFGPDAASRLAAAVAGVNDPDRLEEVGAEAILCANGAEFPVRAEDIARRR